MKKIQFVNNDGTFTIDRPENYTGLYFPLAGEKGLKSALASNYGGDMKLNQNAFVMEPVSIDNLHNNRSTRNFWCVFENGLWSAVGQSATQEAAKFTAAQDESSLKAGFMWHSMERKSKEFQVEAKVTSFVPIDCNVEVMKVTITNAASEEVAFTGVAAIPLYGRSADNIRDHRHVTSLLHRIRTVENGILVKPTLSFDERGHQKNVLTYFVCGVTGEGNKPEGFFPVTADFIGEGGSFIRPRALLEGKQPVPAGYSIDGREALGGIVFEKTVLQPNEEKTFIVLIGLDENEEEIAKVTSRFSNEDKVDACLEELKAYWQKEVNVSYQSGDKDFDNYMKWVSFQPFLRRIFGCSFLPHHDYGKGGRGWRDLWQDCLALLMMNPGGVRQMILDNFGGVRIDGSNATIIGSKQGEFIADRNGITRVWMDHGVWPFMTTQFYIDQTGDIDILNQKVSYFKDGQTQRGTAIDEEWTPEYGNRQKDAFNKEYEGTVLEHLLLQHLCAYYEVGEHNHCLLRGADWNDALDMAGEKGESVAFTCAYAGNMKQLANDIRMLRKVYKQQKIEVLEEMMVLLTNDADVNFGSNSRRAVLKRYELACHHKVSGARISLDAELVAQNLEHKANLMMKNIRENEWVTDKEGNGWFNSYYDNSGCAVEGEFNGNIRMMLTGQVFALMSKTADSAQAKSIVKSAKRYLFDKSIGGYRINTDFREEKYDLGRMFGFAYGEKENGAVFSHMAVMYANALYKNGFVQEGYEALKALSDASLNFEKSYMYPGIPEYFNNDGRGLYAYLTGAASWYMMTEITEAYGIRGDLGNLVLEPKLVAEQFDEKGNAGVSLMFAGKRVNITYHNAKGLEAGKYKILSVSDQSISVPEATGLLTIPREVIENVAEYHLVVELG